MSTNKVLYLCAKGFSNSKIASMTGLSEDDVLKILVDFYNFSGWEQDLDLDVLYIYDKNIDFDTFRSKILSVSPFINDYLINLAYKNCSLLRQKGFTNGN